MNALTVIPVRPVTTRAPPSRNAPASRMPSRTRLWEGFPAHRRRSRGADPRFGHDVEARTPRGLRRTRTFWFRVPHSARDPSGRHHRSAEVADVRVGVRKLGRGPNSFKARGLDARKGSLRVDSVAELLEARGIVWRPAFRKQAWYLFYFGLVGKTDTPVSRVGRVVARDEPEGWSVGRDLLPVEPRARWPECTAVQLIKEFAVDAPACGASASVRAGACTWSVTARP